MTRAQPFVLVLLTAVLAFPLASTRRRFPFAPLFASLVPVVPVFNPFRFTFLPLQIPVRSVGCIIGGNCVDAGRVCKRTTNDHSGTQPGGIVGG